MFEDELHSATTCEINAQLPSISTFSDPVGDETTALFPEENLVYYPVWPACHQYDAYGPFAYPQWIPHPPFPSFEQSFPFEAYHPNQIIDPEEVFVPSSINYGYSQFEEIPMVDTSVPSFYNGEPAYPNQWNDFYIPEINEDEVKNIIDEKFQEIEKSIGSTKTRRPRKYNKKSKTVDIFKQIPKSADIKREVEKNLPDDVQQKIILQRKRNCEAAERCRKKKKIQILQLTQQNQKLTALTNAMNDFLKLKEKDDEFNLYLTSKRMVVAGTPFVE